MDVATPEEMILIALPALETGQEEPQTARDEIDVAQAHDLWLQADKARRLARSVIDPATADTLERLAEEYDVKAIALAGPRPESGRTH
jgi:hypothetical protein